MAEQKFMVGERVGWEGGRGRVEGRVLRYATRSGQLGDFVYAASASEPRYVVETDDGRRSALKAVALSRAGEVETAAAGAAVGAQAGVRAGGGFRA